MTCKSSRYFSIHITPSRQVDPTQTRNISMGLVVDIRLNVDDALNIGANISRKTDGKRFGALCDN